jgi:hypothetical protein
MDAFLESSPGIPEIDCTLSVKPELRRVANQARKPKRCIRCDGAPLSKQFVDSLARNPNACASLDTVSP